ncbi:phage terminase large subunit [Candidatus Contubernalis alkaliaceticus]|uniref:phage terminase large subunit n=1 Tax=Candidatus Contubernalis alkaliaceticus TaxID=338645 RepID=UPI001F4BD29A|nr:phage terminase large subunit [Candidatus Contubernalis alkalaceticus]UNC92721.1 phage terminase large subunit [Candidatus Contubernalis alkalaceticus]
MRKQLAEFDIEFFALTYLPDFFDKPFCQFHKDLIKQIKNLTLEYSCQNSQQIQDFRSNKQGQKLITIAPRGHGKSMLLNFLIILWSLCFNKSPFIVCISANEALAQDFLQKIKDEIVSNDLILEDFGNLKKDRGIWNVSQIELRNGSSLIAKGIKSKIRGLTYKQWRPTLIVLDDIEDDRQSKSEISTEEIKSIFFNTVLSSGDSYTDFVYLGTIISENTLINELYKSATGWNKLFYQAVINFSDSPLWEHWQKIYTDLSNINCVDDADRFFNKHKQEMLKDTSVLWEEKNDYYSLMKQRIDSGETAFWAEQMNNPRSSSDYIFQSLTYWTELPKLEELDICMFVDPAMGKKGGDYSAITILGKHTSTNYKYIIEGLLYRIKPDKLLNEIVNLCKKYPINKLGFESVNFQEYLLDDLKKRLSKEELYHVLPKSVKPRSNKHNRIMNLEPFISRGEILFNNSNILYNNQVKDYHKKVKNDDAADSLQGCFELIQKIKKPKKIYDKPQGW